MHAASIRSELNAIGMLIGYYELLIRATARHCNLIMVAANIMEFERIKNLQIQDWHNWSNSAFS